MSQTAAPITPTQVKKSLGDEACAKIAEQIKDIADAARTIINGPLKRETIVLLLQEASGVGKVDIRLILDALPELDVLFCKPK